MKKKLNFRLTPKQANYCADATVELVNRLSVKGSRKTLRDLVGLHPKYPSLLSVSDTLTEWNIDNFPTKINKEQLTDITFPAIAQLSKHQGRFVVLTNLSQDTVEYLDPESGKISETVEKFKSEWTGVTLLVSKNEKSGEPADSLKKNIDQLTVVRRIATWLFFALLLRLTFSSSIIELLPLVGNSVGIAFCYALLMVALGQNSFLVNAVCGANKNSGCSKVTGSNISTLYGDITLAEVGLTYFAVNFLTIVFASASNANPLPNPLLFWMNTMALPFTLLSVFYQWRIVKAWCILCLLVVGLLWLQWIYSFKTLDSFFIQYQQVIDVGYGFTVTFLAWFIYRPSFVKAQKAQSLEKNLMLFKRGENVFEALINLKPVVNFSEFDKDVVLGSPESTTIITFVTNITCGHCVKTTNQIESWLKKFDEKFKVIIRFVVFNNDNGSIRDQVTRNIISLALRSEKEKMRQAINAWFGVNEKPFLSDWLKEFACEEHELTQSYMQKHLNWCKEAKITGTPTVFYNGRLIPEEYSLEDFEYFLRLKISEEQTSGLR